MKEYKVVFERPSSDSAEREFITGEAVDVNDGNLYIYGVSGKVIKIYRRSYWLSVEESNHAQASEE